MGTPTHHVPIETLLEHRAWVRNLARSLVRDETAVDDLEQQTWMAALKNPPQGASRPWLGAVLRNVASKSRRAGSRRVAREERAARPERVRSTAQVVAEAELHERVVRAVRRLAEPYRSTLLLRFFEGLPPREIAARMDAPVETVRARIRRGLERMRQSFDADYGDRKRWSLMLAPLAGSKVAARTVVSSGVGAMLMSVKIKMAVAIAILLLGVFFFANPFRDDDPREHGTVIADDGDVEQPPVLTGRPEPGEEPGSSAAPEPAPVFEGPHVRVLRGEKAVVGASVRLVTAMDKSFSLQTDTEGRAALPAEATGPLVAWVTTDDELQRFGPMAFGPQESVLRLTGAPIVQLQFKRQDGSVLTAQEVAQQFERFKSPRTLRLISNALFDGSDLLEARLRDQSSWAFDVSTLTAGDVLRPSPEPAEGTWRVFASRPGSTPFLSEPFTVEGTDDVVVDITLQAEDRFVPVRAVDDETEQPLGRVRVYGVFEYGDDQVFLKEGDRRTNDHGEIELPAYSQMGPRLPRRLTWWFETKTHACRIDSVAVAAASDTLVVRCPRRFDVEGTAYLSDGTPAAGRRVMAMVAKRNPLATSVREDGSFTLRGVPYQPSQMGHVGRPGKTSIVLLEGRATLQFQMAAVRGRPGETVRTQIGKADVKQSTASVRGRITAGGVPLGGVWIMARSVGGSDKQVARTSADGRYEISGLKEGILNMSVLCGDPRASDDYQIDLQGDDSPYRLRVGEATEVDFTLPSGCVEVTVVDADTGKPLPGVAVTAEAMQREIDTETIPGFRYTPGWSESSDDRGVALLKALPGGLLRVRIYSREHGTTERENQTAGTAEEPLRLTIRVKREG